VSERTERVASVLHRAVQEVLTEGLADPRCQALMTVTSVKVDEDLREATVRVSVLPESKQELCLHGLAAAAGYIRRKAGDRVSMARMPDLHFRLDRRPKKEGEIMEALARIRQERGSAGPGGQEPASGQQSVIERPSAGRDAPGRETKS